MNKSTKLYFLKDIQGRACGRGLSVVDNKIEYSGVRTGQQGIYCISPPPGGRFHKAVNKR